MFGRLSQILRRRPEVLFLCSATIDETWIRSTAIACQAVGLRARLAICGDSDPQILERYARARLTVEFISCLADLAGIDSELVVTASSGLDRSMFPTKARHFVHMPHSLASLHMIYPADAFDGYDVLFAAGPQHQREWERLSATRRGRARPCVPLGYGKIDVLRELPTCRDHQTPHVLIAPSWGPDNLLDRMGRELVLGMLEKGWHVTVRPHPLFMIERAPVVEVLKALSDAHPNCELENPLSGNSALGIADLLVGDYSGTAFEFCALHARPVVSVNVGLKEVNPQWRALGLVPVELALRAALGASVSPELGAVLNAVERLLADPGAGERAAACAPQFIFAHRDHCGQRAAGALRTLAAA